MKLLFMALGSRGDVEPFLAQAELFAADHEIMCIFPEQFRREVEGLGYAFSGFDKAFLELLNSQTGKEVMGGNGGFFAKANGYLKLMRSSMSMQQSIIDVQRESIRSFQPDRVIFHAKCLYGTVAALAQPDKYILLNAIPCMNHPTKSYSHIGFGKWSNLGPKWNLRTYAFVNGARFMMFKKFIGKYYSDFPELKITASVLKNFEKNDLKTIYSISKHLFPKPEEWPENARIPGYIYRDQQSNYTPNQELESWLGKYKKPVLVTFGSMSNPRPKEISKIIVDLLVEKEIPAIINTSWGGLEKVANSPDSIFYINHIPYDYIMPKLHGVIHHGGSGTTHLTSLNACVQLIIPHIMDQFFWNRLIAAKELGPAGIPVRKLNKEKLSPILDEFYSNPLYVKNTQAISAQMKDEVDLKSVTEFILK